MRRLGLLAAAVAMTAGSAYAADGIKLNNMLTVTGFIDTSYVSQSVDVPGSTTSVDTKTFNMDQAEVDFIFDLGMGLSGQIDLQSVQGVAGVAGDMVGAEQAFINYDFGNGVNLTLGKFDTFIGLEAIEQVDMYQYSHSLVYDLEPEQHTGLAVAYSGEMFNMAGALVNGIGTQNPDVNDAMAIALHVGVVPNKVWSANLNYVASDEGTGAPAGTATTAASELDTTLMTADVQYTNLGWTVGFEYAAKTTDTSPTTELKQTGMSLMANYAYSDRGSITARYSKVENDVAGVTADQSEMSLCGNYGFTPNWMGRLELRKDTTEVLGVDLDAQTIALETTLSF
ncbi:MAG: outer membrane beta-barrel protein [Planctomycetes bacterium]|nr:outer membrane beta-barrel protein [Planctomycetota bacterium]